MLPEGQRRQLAILLAVAAIVVAPFLALLFSWRAGLLVMAAALGVTAWLIGEALPAAPPASRRWLRALMALNIGLAAACVLALFVA